MIPKVLPPPGEGSQAPGQQWGTRPFHDTRWPRTGPRPPRLMDASVVTAEGLMAGAWTGAGALGGPVQQL